MSQKYKMDKNVIIDIDIHVVWFTCTCNLECKYLLPCCEIKFYFHWFILASYSNHQKLMVIPPYPSLYVSTDGLVPLECCIHGVYVTTLVQLIKNMVHVGEPWFTEGGFTAKLLSKLLQLLLPRKEEGERGREGGREGGRWGERGREGESTEMAEAS